MPIFEAVAMRKRADDAPEELVWPAVQLIVARDKHSAEQKIATRFSEDEIDKVAIFVRPFAG